MYSLKTLFTAVGISLLTVFSPAYGIPLNGEIAISGGFVPQGGTSLADATSIDFLEWNGTSYTAGTSGGSFTVASVNENFADYITPSPFILGNINDFSFDGSFTPVSSLWEIGGFSFDLLDVNISTQNSTSLVLLGSGEIYGNGFERTQANFALTSNTYGSTFSWSSSVSTYGVTASVPEPPSILLLGIGLTFLGFARRRMRS